MKTDALGCLAPLTCRAWEPLKAYFRSEEKWKFSLSVILLFSVILLIWKTV